MESMDCDRVRTEEIAERYLLGRLTEPDRDAFEAHFFECDACLDHLRTLEALQAKLARTAILPDTATAIRRAPMWVWVVAAGLLVATAAGLWLAARDDTRVPAPRVTEERPASAPGTGPRATEPSAEILALARVKPPLYVPITLRGPPDRATEQVDMVHYANRDFVSAARGLETALTLDATDARSYFYLGIARLMTGQTDAAIAALEQCLRAVLLACHPPARKSALVASPEFPGIRTRSCPALAGRCAGARSGE